MIDIVQGFQGFDNFCMGFILLEHFTADGNGYAVNRETAADIGRILLNLINGQSKPAD